MQTYVTRNEHAVKIGKSKDPIKRISGLQVGSASDLKVVMIFDGDCERALHKRFKKYHIKREWFSLEILSLYNWISLQSERNDVIGDFAREVLDDKRFPIFEIRYGRLKDYLIERRACNEARLALARCFRAWQRLQRGLDVRMDQGVRFRSDGEYTGTWIYC